MKASSIPISAAFGFGKPEGLTPLQCRYLNECAATSGSLSEVAGRIGVRRELLAQWWEEPSFRRRMDRVVRRVVRRREVTLALVSADAAERLAEGVAEGAKLNPDQRRACVELLKLARSAPRKRPGREKAPEIELPEEIDVEERARLIERLETQE